jgi:predicted Zn-dependent protease
MRQDIGRRLFLLAALSHSVARGQNQELPLASSRDAVNFYIVPTDGVSEQGAGVIARALTKETGLSIKSTLWAPSDVENPFPGTDQYPAENYFPMGARIARTLPEASDRTYFIVLTNRDINSKTGNFRFQFSMHHPAANTSVLSYAHLQHNMDGSASSADVVATRIGKMLLRIVGEMRLGWKRTSDPGDLMFAPIMSIEDVDRMNLTHTIKRRGTASPTI